MKKFFSLIIPVFCLMIMACSRHVDKDAVTVMTFNIRYDNPGDSAYAWSYRVPVISNFLSKEKPDIIGMQEVLYNQYEMLDSVLQNYISVGVGRDDGAKEGELNPVFFSKDRFEFVRSLTFWLSDEPEKAGSKAWGSSLPRIVTWVELVDKNTHQHFFVFNTHFAHDSDLARINSSKMLMKEVDKISSGFPFIVTGDFNMDPKSLGYKILVGPDESVPLFRDSYVISKNKPGGPLGTFNGFGSDKSDRRIDFIFVKNGMKVSDYEAVVKKEHGVFISDHWPVIATVILNKQGK
ncbi:MAG TPA: endonuclease/exonuclease/phosphatase family protein [Bacteroidales bacterium]|nr:endonuclease/exonuclease/phosphatase family protein [Bacteroidales bacterium]